jgi:hypothetical protein
MSLLFCVYEDITYAYILMNIIVKGKRDLLPIPPTVGRTYLCCHESAFQQADIEARDYEASWFPTSVAS